MDTAQLLGIGGGNTSAPLSYFDTNAKQPYFPKADGSSQYDYNTIAGQDLDQLRAQRQGVADHIGNGLLRLVGTGITKTTEGIGFIAGLSGIDNHFEERGGWIAGAADNMLAEWSMKMEDKIKESLPIYHTERYKSGDVFQQMGTLGFWSDDVVDGLAFMLSAYVPGIGISKLGAGLKIGKAVANGIKAGGLFGAPNVVGATRAANILMTSAFATASESMFEAKDARDSVINDLKTGNNGNKRINPTTGQPFTDQEITYLSADAARNTWQQNMTALAISNTIESSFFFAKPLTHAGKSKFILDNFQRYIGKVPKGFERFAEGYAAKIALGGLKGAATEGLYEENIQYSIQKLNEMNARSGELDSNILSGLAGIPGALPGMIDYKDKDRVKSVVLGAIIGAPAAMRSEVLSKKAQDKRGKDNLDELNKSYLDLNSFDAYKKTGSQTVSLIPKEEDGVKTYWKNGEEIKEDAYLKEIEVAKNFNPEIDAAKGGEYKTKDEFVIDSRGRRVFDEDKLAKILANTAYNNDLLKEFNVYEDEGFRRAVLNDFLNDALADNWMFAHFKAGTGEQVFEELARMNKMTPEEVEKVVGDKNAILQAKKNYAKYVTRAKQLQDAYNTINAKLYTGGKRYKKDGILYDEDYAIKKHLYGIVGRYYTAVEQENAVKGELNNIPREDSNSNVININKMADEISVLRDKLEAATIADQTMENIKDLEDTIREKQVAIINAKKEYNKQYGLDGPIDSSRIPLKGPAAEMRAIQELKLAHIESIKKDLLGQWDKFSNMNTGMKEFRKLLKKDADFKFDWQINDKTDPRMFEEAIERYIPIKKVKNKLGNIRNAFYSESVDERLKTENPVDVADEILDHRIRISEAQYNNLLGKLKKILNVIVAKKKEFEVEYPWLDRFQTYQELVDFIGEDEPPFSMPRDEQEFNNLKQIDSFLDSEKDISQKIEALEYLKEDILSYNQSEKEEDIRYETVNDFTKGGHSIIQDFVNNDDYDRVDQAEKERESLRQLKRVLDNGTFKDKAEFKKDHPINILIHNEKLIEKGVNVSMPEKGSIIEQINANIAVLDAIIPILEKRAADNLAKDDRILAKKQEMLWKAPTRLSIPHDKQTGLLGYYKFLDELKKGSENYSIKIQEEKNKLYEEMLATALYEKRAAGDDIITSQGYVTVALVSAYKVNPDVFITNLIYSSLGDATTDSLKVYSEPVANKYSIDKNIDTFIDGVKANKEGKYTEEQIARLSKIVEIHKEYQSLFAMETALNSKADIGAIIGNLSKEVNDKTRTLYALTNEQLIAVIGLAINSQRDTSDDFSNYTSLLGLAGSGKTWTVQWLLKALGTDKVTLTATNDLGAEVIAQPFSKPVTKLSDIKSNVKLLDSSEYLVIDEINGLEPGQAGELFNVINAYNKTRVSKLKIILLGDPTQIKGRDKNTFAYSDFLFPYVYEASKQGYTSFGGYKNIVNVGTMEVRNRSYVSSLNSFVERFINKNYDLSKQELVAKVNTTDLTGNLFGVLGGKTDFVQNIRNILDSHEGDKRTRVLVANADKIDQYKKDFEQYIKDGRLRVLLPSESVGITVDDVYIDITNEYGQEPIQILSWNTAIYTVAARAKKFVYLNNFSIKSSIDTAVKDDESRRTHDIAERNKKLIELFKGIAETKTEEVKEEAPVEETKKEEPAKTKTEETVEEVTTEEEVVRPATSEHEITHTTSYGIKEKVIGITKDKLYDALQKGDEVFYIREKSVNANTKKVYHRVGIYSKMINHETGELNYRFLGIVDPKDPAPIGQEAAWAQIIDYINNGDPNTGIELDQSGFSEKYGYRTKYDINPYIMLTGKVADFNNLKIQRGNNVAITPGKTYKEHYIDMVILALELNVDKNQMMANSRYIVGTKANVEKYGPFVDLGRAYLEIDPTQNTSTGAKKYYFEFNAKPLRAENMTALKEFNMLLATVRGLFDNTFDTNDYLFNEFIRKVARNKDVDYKYGNTNKSTVERLEEKYNYKLPKDSKGAYQFLEHVDVFKKLVELADGDAQSELNKISQKNQVVLPKDGFSGLILVRKKTTSSTSFKTADHLLNQNKNQYDKEIEFRKKNQPDLNLKKQLLMYAEKADKKGIVISDEMIHNASTYFVSSKQLQSLVETNENGESIHGLFADLTIGHVESKKLSIQEIEEQLVPRVESVVGTSITISFGGVQETQETPQEQPIQEPVLTPETEEQIEDDEDFELEEKQHQYPDVEESYHGKLPEYDITTEEAEKLINQFAPNLKLSDAQFVKESVSLRNKLGEEVFGIMVNHGIKLLEKDGKVSKYVLGHEVFHLMYNYYLSPEERAIVDLHGDEETTANLFADYVTKKQTIYGRVKDVFKKILTFFKLYQDKNADLENIFKNVTLGRYRTQYSNQQAERSMIRDVVSPDYELQLNRWIQLNIDGRMFPKSINIEKGIVPLNISDAINNLRHRILYNPVTDKNKEIIGKLGTITDNHLLYDLLIEKLYPGLKAVELKEEVSEQDSEVTDLTAEESKNVNSISKYNHSDKDMIDASVLVSRQLRFFLSNLAIEKTPMRYQEVFRRAMDILAVSEPNDDLRKRLVEVHGKRDSEIASALMDLYVAYSKNPDQYESFNTERRLRENNAYKAEALTSNFKRGRFYRDTFYFTPKNNHDENNPGKFYQPGSIVINKRSKLEKRTSQADWFKAIKAKTGLTDNEIYWLYQHAEKRNLFNEIFFTMASMRERNMFYAKYGVGQRDGTFGYFTDYTTKKIKDQVETYENRVAVAITKASLEGTLNTIVFHSEKEDKEEYLKDCERILKKIGAIDDNMTISLSPEKYSNLHTTLEMLITSAQRGTSLETLYNDNKGRLTNIGSLIYSTTGSYKASMYLDGSGKKRWLFTDSSQAHDTIESLVNKRIHRPAFKGPLLKKNPYAFGSWKIYRTVDYDSKFSKDGRPKEFWEEMPMDVLKRTFFDQYLVYGARSFSRYKSRRYHQNGYIINDSPRLFAVETDVRTIKDNVKGIKDYIDFEINRPDPRVNTEWDIAHYVENWNKSNLIGISGYENGMVVLDNGNKVTATEAKDHVMDKLDDIAKKMLDKITNSGMAYSIDAISALKGIYIEHKSPTKFEILNKKGFKALSAEQKETYVAGLRNYLAPIVREFIYNDYMGSKYLNQLIAGDEAQYKEGGWDVTKRLDTAAALRQRLPERKENLRVIVINDEIKTTNDPDLKELYGIFNEIVTLSNGFAFMSSVRGAEVKELVGRNFNQGNYVKGVYAGIEKSGIIRLIKYSSVILNKDLVNLFPKLREINDYMVEHEIDEIIFKSAVKVGSPNNRKSMKDLIRMENPFEHIINLNAKDWGIQLNPEADLNANIKQNSQAIYMANQIENKYGHKIWSMEARLLAIRNKMYYTRMEKEGLRNLVSNTSTEADYRTTELLQSRTDGNYDIGLDFPSITKKIQSRLLSHISKHIVEIPFKGAPLVMQSEYGAGENLKFKDKDGYTECYVPNIYKKAYGLKEGDVIANEKLLKLIGYRMPTTGLHSLLPLKIKGFLPIADNAIIVPKEIITLTGADYDIDELYVIRHERAEQDIVVNGDVMFTKDTIYETEKNIKALEELYDDLDNDSALQVKVGKLLQSAIRNNIITMYQRLLTDKEHQQKVNVPILISRLTGKENSAKAMYEKYFLTNADGTKEDINVPVDPANILDRMDIHEAIWSGDRLIGTTASFSKGFHMALERKDKNEPVSVNEKNVITIESNKKSYAYNKLSAYELAMGEKGLETNVYKLNGTNHQSHVYELLDSFINLAIDRHNHPYFFRMNINMNTIDAILGAAAIGMDVDTIFKIMFNPILKNLSQNGIEKQIEKIKAIDPEAEAKQLSMEDIEKYINLPLDDVSVDRKDFMAYQLAILKAYENLHIIGRDISKVSKALSVLKALPRTYEEVVAGMDKFKAIYPKLQYISVNNKDVENLEISKGFAIQNFDLWQPHIIESYNALVYQYELINKEFLLYNKEITAFVSKAKQLMREWTNNDIFIDEEQDSIDDDYSEAYISDVRTAFSSWIMAGILEEKMDGYTTYEKIKKDKKIIKRSVGGLRAYVYDTIQEIEAFKTQLKTKGETNYFLDQLIEKETQEIGAYLTLSNFQNNDANDYIRYEQGFIDLPKTIQEKLINIAVLTTGLSFGSRNFSMFIPPKYLAEISSKYDNSLQRFIDSSNKNDKVSAFVLTYLYNTAEKITPTDMQPVKTGDHYYGMDHTDANGDIYYDRKYKVKESPVVIMDDNKIYVRIPIFGEYSYYRELHRRGPNNWRQSSVINEDLFAFEKYWNYPVLYIHGYDNTKSVQKSISSKKFERHEVKVGDRVIARYPDNIIGDKDYLARVTKVELEGDESIVSFTKDKAELKKREKTANTITKFKEIANRLEKRFRIKVKWINDPNKPKGSFENGVVTLNEANITADTPFHEVAHPFIEMIRKQNKTLFEKMKTEISGKDFAKIKEAYPELSEDEVYAEAMVTKIGLKAADLQKLNWIKAGLKWITDNLKVLFNSSIKDIEKLTLQDIALFLVHGTEENVIEGLDIGTYKGSFESRVIDDINARNSIAGLQRIEKDGEYIYNANGKELTSLTTFIQDNIGTKPDPKELAEKYAKNEWDNYTTKEPSPENTVNIKGKEYTFADLVNRKTITMDNARRKGNIIHLFLQKQASPVSKHADINNKIREQSINPGTRASDDMGVSLTDYDWMEEGDWVKNLFEEMEVQNHYVNPEKYGLGNSDELAPEIMMFNEDLGIGTTADLVAERKNGSLVLSDYKTGNFRLEGGRRFKYGTNPVGSVYDDAIGRASLELAWRAFMMKINDPATIFEKIQVVKVDTFTRIPKAVEVNLHDCLDIIEDYIRKEKPELYDKYKEAGLFDDLNYGGQADSVSELLKQMSGLDNKSMIALKSAELEVVINTIKHLEATKNREHLKMYEQKRDSLFKLITELNSIAGAIPQADSQPMGWMKRYLGNKYSVSDHLMQGAMRFMTSQQNDAYKKMLLFQKEFSDKIRPVKAEYDAKHGMTKGKEYVKGYNQMDFWSWAWISRDMPTGDQGKFLVTKNDTERWMQLSDAQKALIEFINKTKKELWPLVMGKTLYEEPMTGRPKRNKLASNINELDDSWIARIPMKSSEIAERNKGGVFSKEYMKHMYHQATAAYHKSNVSHVTVEPISDLYVKDKYFGNDEIIASENYSFDIEAAMTAWVENMYTKKYMDPVAAYMRALKTHYEVMDAGKFKHNIGFLEDHIKLDILGEDDFQFGRTGIKFPTWDKEKGKWKDKKDWDFIDEKQFLMSLKNWVTYTTMWFKPVAATFNTALIVILNTKEAMKGSIAKRLGIPEEEINFTLSDLTGAVADYFEMVKDMSLGKEDDNKLFNIAKNTRYLADNYDYKIRNDFKMIKDSRLFDSSHMYILHRIGEDFGNFSMLAAQMRHRKYNTLSETGEKKEISLWEGYDSKGEWIGGKRGQYEVTSGIREDLYGLTDDEVTRMKRVSARIQGGYRQEEKVAIELYVFGKWALQFKKYLPAVLENMLQGGYQDTSLGVLKKLNEKTAEGMDVYKLIPLYNRGSVWVLGDAMTSLFRLQSKKFWQSSSALEKQALIDAALVALTFVSWLLVKGAVPDDDKKTNMFQRLDRLLSQDITQGYNPVDILDALKSQTIIFPKLLLAFKGLWELLTEGMWGVETEEGYMKGAKPVMKATPIFSIKQEWEKYFGRDTGALDDWWLSEGRNK